MARDLQAVSVAELLAEIDRRNKSKFKLPTPLEEPNLQSLIAMVIDGTREINEKGFEDEDFEHYVYETAIEAIYGKAYWEWFKKRTASTS